MRFDLLSDVEIAEVAHVACGCVEDFQLVMFGSG